MNIDAFYQQALDALPAVAAVRSARARLRAAQVANPPREANLSYADAVNAATDALLAGEDIPADLGAQALAGRREHEEYAARFDVLRAVDEQLASREAVALRAGADDGLGWLATKLPALLDELRAAAADLGSARSAEAAIGAGGRAAAAWSTMQRLAETWRSLRHAQTHLLRASVAGADSIETARGYVHLADVLQTVGTWRDPDTVWVAKWDGRPAGKVVEPPPWPVGDGTWERPEITPVHMAWLATAPATPWLPPRRELVKAWDELRARHVERVKAWDVAALRASPEAMQAHVEDVRRQEQHRHYAQKEGRGF